MSMPTMYEVFLPFLKCLADQQPRRVEVLRSLLDQHFQLTPAEREECVKSGYSRFSNRVAWAIAHLKSAQLIERVERGIFKITSRGLEVIQTNPEKLDIKFLRQYSEYRGVMDASSAKKANDSAPSSTDDGSDSHEMLVSPAELIESQVAIIRRTLAVELREQISSKPPVFFERLVVQLLVRMGYGGSFEDAWASVGGPGDGGIDGVIKEDKLGLDMIYIQAKCWNDKQSVGRPEVQKFVGALAGRGAKKGVFITTTTFTAEAKSYQPQNDTKIVLIDGEQLFQLMIDYNLGVTTVNTYEIKRIDSDFFEDD